MLIIIAFLLIGGALIETPIIGYRNGEYGIGTVIAGFVFGSLFVVPALILLWTILRDRAKERQEKDTYMQELLEALKPGFREAVQKSGLDPLLVSFRNHYSEFLSKEHVGENEPIQHDVTQVFRNVMQFQKNRLTRLGLTCEMTVRRMQYTHKNGPDQRAYSDGKYRIIEVTEEVAARTVYKKGSKPIHTKQDRDTANYTVIQTETVGSSRILCPNCGAETTREALLDGCDYCGTKFTVEDLGTRVAVFAFRPDFKLRYEKYLRQRNKLLALALLAAVASVFLGFTIYAIVHFKELLASANGGIVLTVMANLFAILIASPVYIISFIIVYAKYIFPILALLGFVSWLIYRAVQNLKNTPMLDRTWEKQIRRTDPNFSIMGFYSGVQNKLSAVLFADTAEQLQAFASGDLTPLLGRYANVAGVEVRRMAVTDYHCSDALQSADVEAALLLTRYTGRKCVTRREYLRLTLAKSAACKTQVVCAPAILTCKGCGASLDLLQGKRCPQCGRELNLIDHDWVIRDIRRGLPARGKKR